MSISIAAFSGSLRKESSTKLVKAFQQSAAMDVTVRITDVSKLPFKK